MTESSTTADVHWQTRGEVRVFWAGDERLEATLDELAALSAAEPPRGDFVPTLLQLSATAAKASAAALWIAEPSAGLTLVRQFQQGEDGEQGGGRESRVVFSSLAAHAEEAHSSGQPATIRTGAGAGDMLVLLCPWRVSLAISGVVAIAISADLPTDARQSAEQFTHAIAAIAADYFRNLRLDELSAEQGMWRQFEELTLSVHPTNDLDRAASAIVNEGRRLLGADRLSLAVHARGRYRLAAVSGVTVINRRGYFARRLEELCGAVAAGRELVWRPADAVLAPQIEAPLDRYLEEAHARTIAIAPLICGSKAKQEQGIVNEAAAPDGVLVAEWFELSQGSAAEQARLGVICRQSEMALSHVLEMDRLPFVRVNRALAKITWLVEARQWPRTRIWLAAAVAVVAFFVVCPADFEVAADGELQPAERRELFAPMDGVVLHALADHGERVSEGQVLARLRSPALELEMARVTGERQTAEKRWAAVRTARLELDQNSGGEASGRYLQLTAEEEEIKQSLTSLERQGEILGRQERELEIASPIAGQVLTWDARRLLANRPVERGQPLLSVGNTSGAWSVELHVPDDEIGYVLAEHAEGAADGRPSVVWFILASDPGVRRRGEIERVAMRSAVEAEGAAPTVTVTVRIDEPDTGDFRPGTSVVGKIDCGWRSLGFVWFHRAWNAVRRRVLF